MRYNTITLKNVYRLRLERGEEVMETLTDFCKEKGITHGTISGLGAIERAEVGYYNLDEKEYASQMHKEPHEVAAMSGNVALIEVVDDSENGVGNEPFLHIHVVLSDAQNNAFGGHLFKGYVAVTLEIELIVYSEAVKRVHDDTIGLKLLDL